MTGPAVTAPAATEPQAPVTPAAAPAPSAQDYIAAFREGRAAAGAPPAVPPVAPTAPAQPEPHRTFPAKAPVVEAPAAVDPNAPVVEDQAAPEGDPSTDPNLLAEELQAEPETFVVTIPGREPGTDFEIEVADQETYERLNQLRNAAIRGDRARAMEHRAQAVFAQQQEVLDQIAMDPIGFVGQYLNPEQQAEIGLGILLHEEIWDHIKPALVALLNDDKEVRVARADYKNRRHQHAEAATVAATERRAATDNANVILQGIQRLTPPVPPEVATQFQNDLRQTVIQFANDNNLKRIHPQQLLGIVTHRLVAWGIDPSAAHQRLYGAPHGAPQPAPAAVAAPATRAPRRAAPVAPATPTAQQFTRGAAARKAVAAAAPPGAGAPGMVLPSRPKGMNIKQAADWARQNFASQPPR